MASTYIRPGGTLGIIKRRPVGSGTASVGYRHYTGNCAGAQGIRADALWSANYETYKKSELTLRTILIQRVTRWRFYPEAFDVSLRYTDGEKNVLLDCFSRLPRTSKLLVGDNEQLTDDINKIMLIKAKCRDFGFKSKNIQHPGETRLTECMKVRFYHPCLMQYYKEYICKEIQM